MQKLSQHWNLEYDDSFYEPKPLGIGCVYLNDTEKAIYKQNSAQLFGQELQKGNIVKQQPRKNLTAEEENLINNSLGQKYRSQVNSFKVL